MHIECKGSLYFDYAKNRKFFMKIHEYQGKEILRQFGVPVPKGVPAFTAQEALEAALKIGGIHWMIKVQTHVGGDLNDCLVQKVNSLDELKQVSDALLGMQLLRPETGTKEQKIRRLLVEEVIEAQVAYDISFAPDRHSQKIAVTVSPHYGYAQKMSCLDYQEVAPVCLIDPLSGITSKEVHRVLDCLNFPVSVQPQVEEILKRLYQACVQTDSVFLQLSPLMLSTDGRILVAGVDFIFDNHALFRQAEIFALRDLDEEIPQAIEALAYGLTYKERGGRIGCLTSGQGMAQAMEDLILLAGDRPACFVDVGGKVTKEKVSAALEIILKNPRVDVILINIFDSVMDCREIALGIVEGIGSRASSVPLVVRLEGDYKLEGRQLLLDAKLAIIYADDLAGGVHCAVQARG